MASVLEQTGKSLKSLYPRPAINQTWLSNTLVSLLESSPGLSRQLQIKGCHRALMQSHLELSTVAGTGFPPNLVNSGDEAEPLHDQIVFAGIKGCLVMVVGITEVGSSAFNLRKNLNERREARKGTARIRRLAGEGEDDEDDDAEASLRYPRGMLKLELSDGQSVCKAIEYKRINALKLGDTRLGTKLLLRNVRVLRGVLLLTPESCAVKSEADDGLYAESRDEAEFDRRLRERLGIEQQAETQENDRSQSPLAPPQEDDIDDYIPDDFDLPDALASNPLRPEARARPAPAQAASCPVVPRPPRPAPDPAPRAVAAPPPPPPPPPEDYDILDSLEDWDEDALLAAAEADAAEEQLAQIREYERISPPPAPAAPHTRSLARPPPSESAPAVALAPLFLAPPQTSNSGAQASQDQAGPSTSKRQSAAPRPARPALPVKPLFPPFTAASSSKRAASAAGASSSSQRPTSQLEPLIISSSPEPEPVQASSIKSASQPRKKGPLKREAPSAALKNSSTRASKSSSGAASMTATGKRVKGRPKPDVEVIEID